jgi:gliding motility-associated-like protein
MRKKITLVLLLLLLCLDLFSQNNPPVLSATDDQIFCPGSSIKIAPSFTITNTDPGDTGVDSFSIQISGGYQKNFDKLSLDNVSFYPSISTAKWSEEEGKLKILGVGSTEISYADLNNAIIEVVYETTATTFGSERLFSLTIGDANYLPSTKHFYQYIEDIGITWTQARAKALGRDYYGRPGYLATLLTQEEADFAGKQAAGAGWIGGSDAGTPDVWKWVTGPEAGTIFWQGRANGFSPNGFAFWNNRNGSNEPNNYQNRDEDYVHITAPGVGTDGSWNDLTNTGDASGNFQPKGYIVEYGVPGDPDLNIVADTRIFLAKDPTIATLMNPICSGDNAVFTIKGMANSTVTYTTDGGTTNSTVTLDGLGDGTVTVTGAMANTTLKLMSIDFGNCTSTLTNSATVTINPNPAITSLTSNGAVCIGTDAIFTIKGTANAIVTYTTDGGLTNPTLILDASGEKILTISGVNINTTINLSSINNSSTNCSSSLTNSTTVTISPSPAITSLTSNDPICSGTDAIFIINGTANTNVSYTTDGGATNQSVTLDGSGQGTATVSGAMLDTTIKLTSIDNNGCTSSLTNSDTVTINPNPAISSLTSNSPVCIGTDAIFTVKGSANTTVTYTTDGGITNPTLNLGTSGENTITITGITVDTTIELTGINNSSCSSILTNTETVKITPDPVITSLTSNNPICSGTDAIFTINGTANATVTYTTNAGATNQSVTLDSTGEGTVTVSTPIADTTIQLGSIDIEGCSIAVTDTAMVNSTTTPDFDLAKNTYFLCKDIGTITLETLNPLEIDYIYEWKKEGTKLSGVSNSIDVNSAGNYTVKAFSITGFGCESSEKSIEVINSEEATITNDKVLIVDDSNNNSLQILTSNLGDGDYEFSLDDPDGSYTDTSFFQNIPTGMHTLYARDKNECGGITTYDFFVLAYPKFFTPNGDGENDIWKIEGADNGAFTVADISIYNRFGVLLFQSDASNIGWDGLSQGKTLPSNTYWFKVILNGMNGRKIEKTGRVSLIRK